MRKVIILFLFLIPVICFGREYYVSVNGSDANNGSIGSPFKNLQKLNGILVAGDVAYIRGGIYTSTYTPASDYHLLWNNLTGTASNPIRIENYPGETVIFDLDNMGIPTACNVICVYIIQCSYLYVKGITVRNMRQVQSGCGISRGMSLAGSNNCRIDRCSIYNMGGTAFIFEQSQSIPSVFNKVVNCDFSYTGDPRSDNGADAYDNSDGISCTGGDISTNNTIDSCRVFMCADDGFDAFGTNGIMTIKSSWFYWNGYKPWGVNATNVNPATMTPLNPAIFRNNPAYVASSGEGVKLGPAAVATTQILHYVWNNLSVENGGTGFASNSLNQLTGVHQLWNNIAYGNVNDGLSFGAGWCLGTNQQFKNNWSWNNNQGISGANFVYDGNDNSGISNNLWMSTIGGDYGNLKPPLTITNAQFVSINSLELAAPRKADGSLPDISFLHLVNSSTLNDAGVNVGLPFCGTAPALGCFEQCGLPTVSLGADRVLTLPTNSTSFTPTTTGGTSFQWIKYSGGTAVISSPNTANTNIGSLVAGVYGFSLTVTNSTGSVTDSVLITVNAPNTPPTCSAGTTPITITLPVNSFALSGTGASTAGNTVSFLWAFTLGTGTIANNTAQNTTATIATASNCTVSLLVTDNGNGLTCTSSKSVTVNPAIPLPPVVSVSPYTQIITLPTSSVNLMSMSTTPQGTITARNWTKISGGACTIANPTSINTTVTGFAAAGIYRFKFCATNSDGLTSCDSLSVTVNPAIVPTAVCAANITITLPINFCTISGNGTGALPLGYTWTKLASSPSSGTIVNNTLQSAQAINLVQGVYQFEFTVLDANGNTAKDTQQVTVLPALIIPVANAGSNQSITLPTSSVSLAGSGSGGTINSYQWTKLSGVGGSFSAATSANTNFTGLSVGTYLIQLRVGNTDGNFGLDSLTVTVNPAIVPPTCSAGADKIIQSPITSAALNGSGTGTNITFLWTKLAYSPSGGNITNATTPVTQANNLIVGTYKFELKVTDINLNIALDTMSIQVLPTFVPPIVTVTPESQTIVLPTNATLVSGSAIISNGSTPTYLWQKLAGSPAGGTITSNTSATTGITALQKGFYTYSLTATDSSGLTGSDTLVIEVTDQPQPFPGFKWLRGSLINNKTNLTWAFEGAETGQSFSVQKQVLILFWTTIGTVSARKGVVNYTYIDNSTKSGNNTYRTKYGNYTSSTVTVKKK